MVPKLTQEMRSIFGDELFEVADTYAAQSAVAGAAGWGDPAMAGYDHPDSHPLPFPRHQKPRFQPRLSLPRTQGRWSDPRTNHTPPRSPTAPPPSVGHP